MNRIFRIVWSQALHTWVVVSELATRRGKRSGGKEVDERVAPQVLVLDRDMVEGSPPATAWPLRVGILLALLGLYAPAQATDYYWDINDATAGAGGTTPSGTWSTGGVTLTTDANGNIVVVPQTTTTADRITFSAGTDATGSYTVNVSGTQNIGGLTFQEGTVLLTGGTINFGSVAGQITADTTTDTIASVLTGTNGLTFGPAPGTGGGAATGSLILTGTNTFTGIAKVATNLTLAAPGGNALGGVSEMRCGDAILSTRGCSITLGAAEQINNTAQVTLFGTAATGAQVFALNGFNETIGGLSMRSDGGVSTVTVRNGAATDVTLTLAGAGNYNAGFGTGFSGRSITDGGVGKLNLVVALASAGNQNFYGTVANYTGTTTINSGNLRLENTSNWASNVILNGGTLTLAQFSASVNGNYAGAATRTHANTITGTSTTASINKLGDGTVILTGINTYRGGTRISTGTLQAGSTSAFGINSGVTVVSGATLNLNGFNNTIGFLDHSSGLTGGTVQLGSATLTVGGGDKSNARGFGGVITGSGNLVKVGTGTQQLSGTNTYTGTTTINGGTLQLGHIQLVNGTGNGLTGTLGTGAVTINAAGTLAFARLNAHTVANTITGTGTIAQTGTGTTTLTAVNSIGTTRVSAGTLDIDGTLNTGTLTMGAGTLNVDGTVQASGATQTVIGNTTGTASTVRIGSGGTLLATGDLGDGSDTLDVFGTLNTGAGSLLLGDGDDNFLIHDGTNVVGTVIGGAGVDTYIYDITGVANVGTLLEFEGLTKRSAGTLNLTGAGTETNNVRVEGGTLNVQAGATVVAQGAGSLNTMIASGTTLNVDGTYTTSTNADTFDVAGTVSGSGLINLNDGDDTLILRDGANLGGLVNAIDGGGGDDTLNADIAGIATLGGAINFETLTKTSGGILNVDGPAASSFGTVNVLGGTLDIGATGAINDVNDATVASGATLNVDGDFGFTTGADSLTVAGTVTGLGGIDMLDGDDIFTIQDGADLSGLAGAVDGGSGPGIDTLVADIAGIATLGGAINFETLTKTNTGTLNINGPASSQFDTVLVQGGTLVVGAGAIVDPQNTVVSSGATMTVNGLYNGTAGQDTFTVSGTVNGTGNIDLLGDDDTLTLNDGADISGLVNPLDGGAHGAGDTVVLNNASAFAFNGSNIVNFESLLKTNIGTATLTGIGTFNSGTTINGGTLDIDGTLETPTVALADDTILNVDGVLNAGPVDPAIITGSAGTNTVTIAGTALATGDLGGGNDVLDVTGTLNTGAGTLALGDGDDSFVVHDGANIVGTIDGGAGNDSRLYDINGIADLGAVVNFEGLTKTGTGILNVNGPAATDLQEVNVLGGTLNVGPGASMVATAGSTLTTTVASGATLNVDGSFGCGALNDTMNVSGTVSGAGTIDLCAGDDTLTLNDGAVLSLLIDGGTHGTGDTVVLNNAAAMTLDASDTTNFEILTKNNTGVATLTGTQTWSGGVNLNAGTLTVDAAGTLFAPTLAMADDTVFNVEGFASGGPLFIDSIAITGSAGINTVVVGENALLRVAGGSSLGDGDDVLDVAGVLDVIGGSFDLGAGDDRFIVHDTTSMLGAIDAGAGNDLLEINVSTGNLVPLGSLMGFESLGKSGLGTLQINGPSSFIDVEVLAGTLDVAAGGSVAAQDTLVSSGATLNLDGSYTGTAGNDTFTVAGIVTGAGTLDLLDGDDTFTIQNGADLSGLANSVDGGAGTDTFVADLTGSATLGGAINFETLTKTNTGTLNIDGAAPSAFTTVNVDGGTLDVGVGGIVNGVVTTTVANGATLNVDGIYTGSAGNDTFDLAGTVSGSSTIDLAAGDDTLTLSDGAVLNTVINGGTGTGDQLVLDNTGNLTFDATNTAGFELLQKNNGGEATLTGTQSFTGGTAINGGTLTVAGALETPTVTLADDTTLNVAGSLQGNGGATATITGTAGINTVTISGTALATGNLGAGNDTLDVSGTLDTGGVAFQLGDGDDNFVVHDGTIVIGTIDGGAGNDSRTYDINGVADLGALVNFEGLTKSGTGTLNINGPGATDLQDVQVLGGTLNVGAGASVVATTGSSLNTVVASGAILNVDGSYGCGASDDTMTVSGTVSGSGTIDMCAGDDTLTLTDSAVLNNIIDGGANGTGDTVVLDSASAMTFDAVNTINFEALRKEGAGIATLVGTQSYQSTTINGGTLAVAGTLETPTVNMGDDTTLTVDGLLQGASGTAATITGSAGTNTVTVNGTLLANGDLLGGNDVLDVSGTLDTMGGTFNLGDGDDTLTIHDGTNIIGTVVAGNGNDTFNADIAGVADLGAVQQFETLSKSGTGELNINGLLSSDFTTVNVLAGTLDVTAGGIVIAQNTTVAAGSTLNVDGSYTGTVGSDTFTVAGTVTGSSSIGLLAGDDTFTIQDGANLSGLANPVDGGDGTDTFVADLAGSATLGGAVNFETLTKTNTGTLHIDGLAPSSFTTVNVDGGTLDIGVDGALTSQSTTIAAGATLNVQGEFSGTAGDDTFTSSGTVIGALGFADGNDTVAFNGGDVSGLTSVDGGAGGSDLLSFSSLSFDGGDFALAGWERVELLNDSTMTLGSTFAFGGGVLAIDATSQLIANAGASIGGSVENAGLINVGANRLAITGGYNANNAALQLTVSPGNATSGGLDIAGDVTGNTFVIFASDGSDVPLQQHASILVISSANDDLATAGGFIASETSNGYVRLTGSISPWSFDQHADKSWYLDAVAGILPETAGYAVVPSIGHANVLDNNRLLFQRMGSVRNDDKEHCKAQDADAYGVLTGECHGVWMAVTGSDLEMGADPGFEFSGDSVGAYVGVDGLLQDRGTRTFRGGLYAGFQRGNYWTTGVNSTDLPGIGESNVQVDTPIFGMYGSFNWRGGTYLDLHLTAQLPKADIVVADGFHEEISGNSLTLSTQLGHRFALESGWTVEPQVQLSTTAMSWGRGQVDASGKALVLDGDVFGTARASVRAEKAFEMAGGARVRPWATLGLQDTMGEKQEAFSVVLPGPGANTQAFPNHDLGLTATLDVGVEVELNKSVSLFGALSYGESLEGTDTEQRQANLGVRIRW